MMLRTGLVRVERRSIMVVTQETKLESLAARCRRGDGRPTDDESLVQDAWEMFQLFELADEGLEDRLRRVMSEFEQDCVG